MDTTKSNHELTPNHELTTELSSEELDAVVGGFGIRAWAEIKSQMFGVDARFL